MMRILYILFVLASGSALAQAEDSPKTGLVLAGGGARGIAHAGVIQALEEMRIPIHAIAGTSMGALVGGIYATGKDAEDLRDAVWNMDWEAAFEDSVERSQRPQRRKADDYDYPTDISFAVNNGVLAAPLGLIQGQQARQIIKELTSTVGGPIHFDDLPIPFRAVATDIETGGAFVFDEGSLVTAMRASMSIPELLAPVEYEGRLLVDGGLANNVPVDVARAMGVDRVIVVDIGESLRNRDEISSMFALAGQMVSLLTRRNSEEQLATLQEQDMLISPDLANIGVLDFNQFKRIYRAGYDAALALQPKLSKFQVTPEDWSRYLAARELPELEPTTVDRIVIRNDSPVSDALIRIRLTQDLGEPLNRQRLLADIQDIYALGYWQIVDFDLRNEDEANVLYIDAQKKPLGNKDLKFGLNLVTDLDGTNDFNLGASYLLTGLNALGGEAYSRIQLGNWNMINGEFYQPLDLHSRWFVVPYLGYEDYEVFSLGPDNDSEGFGGIWRVRRGTADLGGGVNIARRSQLRAGVVRRAGQFEIDNLSSSQLPEDDFNEGAYYLSYRYDGLDNAFFPTEGGLFYTRYEAHRDGLGSDADFERWQSLGQAAFSFGDDKRNTVILSGRLGQHFGAANEPQNYFQLGGLFNLSGLPQNFLSGRQMAFMSAQYQRRLSEDSVLPIDLPLYVGFSLEGGQLWSERSEMSVDDLITAGSVYLAIDSPIGPAHIALGSTEGDDLILYLSIGWPFLTNQTRIGR